jgi:hypothetical protein
MKIYDIWQGSLASLGLLVSHLGQNRPINIIKFFDFLLFSLFFNFEDSGRVWHQVQDPPFRLSLSGDNRRRRP